MITITDFLLWTPKSCLDQNHTISFGFAFRYAFWTLAHLRSRPLRSSRMSNIWTLSFDTTYAYIIKGGMSTLCQSATNMSFHMNPASSLTSKMMCDIISLYPIRGSYPSSLTSKAMMLLVISLSIASFHRVFLFYFSTHTASSYDFGRRTPYLWFRFQ